MDNDHSRKQDVFETSAITQYKQHPSKPNNKKTSPYATHLIYIVFVRFVLHFYVLFHNSSNRSLIESVFKLSIHQTHSNTEITNREFLKRNHHVGELCCHLKSYFYFIIYLPKFIKRIDPCV